MSKHLQQFEEDDSAGWITTFADLMTLLLVFFVLMFSMSTIEAERFQQVLASIQISFGNPGTANSVIELPHDLPESLPTEATEPTPEPLPPPPPPPEPEERISPEWQQLAERLKLSLDKRKVGDLVEVEIPMDGKLSIQVQGTALFDSGSADLNYQVDEVLEGLLEVFRVNNEFGINIQGHTDNLPISTSRYESNWELSAIRATTVLRYFLARGISPKRVTATGYGDSLPIASNDTPEGRAKNRRIEFVLEKRAPAYLR